MSSTPQKRLQIVQQTVSLLISCEMLYLAFRGTYPQPLNEGQIGRRIREITQQREYPTRPR